MGRRCVLNVLLSTSKRWLCDSAKMPCAVYCSSEKICLNTFSFEKIRGKSKLAYYQPETLHHLMFHSTLYSFTFIHVI